MRQQEGGTEAGSGDPWHQRPGLLHHLQQVASLSGPRQGLDQWFYLQNRAEGVPGGQSTRSPILRTCLLQSLAYPGPDIRCPPYPGLQPHSFVFDLGQILGLSGPQCPHL